MLGTRNDAPGNPVTDEPLPPSTDEQLMVAFRRGSSDAFTELFSRYKQPLFGFFRRRVSDPGRAEELTQDTFVAILSAAERYEPTALFRTYLYAIGFKILHAYRRKAVLRAVFLGSGPGDREPMARDTLDTDTLVRDAVSKLKHKDRELIMLREFEQLSYVEIAELLRLPINTVRSRLFRARMTLHGLLVAPAPKLSTKDFAECEERK
jgi:RNA polymerase sigma-70 factor (ECF subfamily)